MSTSDVETTGPWRARAHRTAKNFNWDYGCDKLLEIIRHRCDLGTALMIYWKGRPDFYRQYRRRCDIRGAKGTFDMLVEIERRVADGFYTHRNIPFNPFDDQGYNWCGKPKRDVYCELPEAMYRGVGSPEEMAKREPWRTGIPDLPIGLSALADADPRPQNEIERAIVYLNSLNSDLSGDVVKMSDGQVTEISFFSNWNAVDEDLRYLELFPELGKLELGQKMTDQSLENLRFVTKLRSLSLSCIPITDHGLSHLHYVPELEELNLHGCKKITDAGLVHVGKLTNLRCLDLGATKIGDAGMAHLQKLANLEQLEVFYHTKITNAGLSYLAGMNKLRYLRISFTKVGDRGLVHLEKLPALSHIVLGRTKVSEAGVERLRLALPGCNVSTGEYV
jgi:hypothetical protein